MRERTDKATANFVGVFDKVVKSIDDDLRVSDRIGGPRSYRGWA